MSEYPITFPSEMVRAILERRKTQFRRVILPQPPKGYYLWGPVINGHEGFSTNPNQGEKGTCIEVACPYGLPGDVLWVREAWATVNTFDALPPLMIPHGIDARRPAVWYDADPGAGGLRLTSSQFVGRKREAKRMPRWASRLSLEIVRVRVERVQDISEMDAMSEGMSPCVSCAANNYRWRHGFQDMWDADNYNNGYGWHVNPYVWVREFKVISRVRETR